MVADAFLTRWILISTSYPFQVWTRGRLLFSFHWSFKTHTGRSVADVGSGRRDGVHLGSWKPIFHHTPWNERCRCNKVGPSGQLETSFRRSAERDQYERQCIRLWDVRWWRKTPFSVNISEVQRRCWRDETIANSGSRSETTSHSVRMCSS